MKRIKLGMTIVWLLALMPQTVFAHEGVTRLRLNQYDVAPGQPLTVAGINLGTDLIVEVMLVGEETTLLLGSALCDGHGDFSQQFILPPDLPEGIYTVQVIDSSIAGQAIMMTETSFKISNTAVPLSENGVQVIAFSPQGFNWQPIMVPGLIIFTFILLMVPPFNSWRRQKAMMPSRPQNEMQNV